MNADLNRRQRRKPRRSGGSGSSYVASSPGGTITFEVFDVHRCVIATYVGTDNTGATETDPTGGGADPNNNMVLVTSYQYDNGQAGGDGNLIQQTQHVSDSETRVTDFVYDWRNRRTDTDGEIDFYEQVTYDNLNRVIRTERYDTTAQGNLIARSDTLYDDRGRVYRTIRYAVDASTGAVGNALVDNTWYDTAGNVVKLQPAGLMLHLDFEYDSLGRLVKQIDPLNGETLFAFDDAGNRVSLTDAENNVTTWGYNGIGQLVKETSPLDDDRLFEYNDAGLLSVRTDRNGRVIEFAYDAGQRPVEERWKEGESTVNTIQFAYDPGGRLRTASDDYSSYAYTYDLNGGMTEVDNDGTPGVARVVLSAGYNRMVEREWLAAKIHSTNDFLNGFGYDALGRMSRVDQQANGGNSVEDKRVDFAYEVRGGYSTINRYADVAATKLVAASDYSYDDFARLIEIEHTKGTTPLAKHEYRFDANRLIDRHTTVDGDSNYKYDDAAQLTEALHAFQANEDYSYDLTGNRTNTGYSTGTGNRLFSDGTFEYEYDPEGNCTKKTAISTGETVEYAWDHRNRLVKLTFKDDQGQPTKIIEYRYDVHNRRIAKRLDVNANSTIDEQWHYVYDPMIKEDLPDVVLVFDASGGLRSRYLQGPDVDQLLADEDGSGDVRWSFGDHLGTIRDLAEYDQSQDETTIINHIRYDAFGRITGQSDAAKTPPFAFTGREWDPDAQLYYYRARWYDASPGRFLTEDPRGVADPNEGERVVANVYKYVHNSSTMLVDPSGQIPPALAAAIVAACGGCFACTAPGFVYCTLVSEDINQFVQCLNLYIEGLPFVHQCACAVACGACPFTALAAAV